MFDKIELSVSSYDTAWVAMVPSPDSPQYPCFPECMIWLMQNQLHDGSWGLPDRPSWLVKDALSCTLASVLALKRWGIGEENMNKGIKFIESKLSSAIDEKEHTPIGFDIIFPGMIEYAKDLNLNFSLRSNDMDTMLQRRQSELRRMEIKRVLDETYRCWLQGEEEIFLDTTTCAMAFRMLRAHGYEVSADLLTQLAEENQFFKSSLKGNLKDIGVVLELYKASQMMIYPEELVLEKQKLWTSQFLKHELSKGSFHSDRVGKYVRRQVAEDALEFMYHANLDRLAHKRNIKHYGQDSIRILKTSFRSSNIGNEDFQKLAVDDFNFCQSIYREELKHLDSRWVVEKRLDKLKYARQKMAYCYFSVAATLIFPELSHAREFWAKNGVLITVVDDFFDVGGSEEELVNLVQLIEEWNVKESISCCSEDVEILYSALHSTICEIGHRAVSWQGRNVTSHIVEIWLNVLKSMLKEAEWSRTKTFPTFDEYMIPGHVSIALGPLVLSAIYFVGPKLSKEVVRSPEFCNLFKLMGTCGRLLNDIQTFKRESKDGKWNAVSMQMSHSVTAEEVIEKIRARIDSKRRELLRLVLQEIGSIVPRACKDLFWNMSKVVHLFYMKDDGFTQHDLLNAVNAVIHEAISVDEL
ncbi:hypothetical protein Dsin_014863 [Dipteronia sinensis]|uniref:Uncharacterized protein n=1 Tax=Dipteronia sinensis TaxID=43782 RepID=A0AAE0AN67_9ROSI|nr:hypothetical protein Dsin_014863 [Dipteronia sinensis]